MSRFVRQAKTDKVVAPWWEPWEWCKVGKYNISQRDEMNVALVEVVGPYGEIPLARLKEATAPVLVAGLRGWSFRDLDEDEVARLYEARAEELGKDVATLTDEDKCDAVKDVDILPMDEEWMRKLEVEDGLFIANAIRFKNRGRTKEEKEKFFRRAGDGDRDEESPAGWDDAGDGDLGDGVE